jgi:hypothetical protein
MTAIASGAMRQLKVFKFSSIELAATASIEYKQGSLVGFDTATGLIRLGGPSTTFIPVGFVAEAVTLGASGGTVRVNLFREVFAWWMKNDGTDTVVSTDIGGLAYVLDDQTVKRDDDVNTLSVMGRVWALDSMKGVLVEPVSTVSGRLSLSGLDN